MKSTKINHPKSLWQRYAVFVIALLAIALGPAHAQTFISGTSVSADPYWASGAYELADPLAAIDVLTEQQANDLFRKLKNTKGIPFDYPDDGCFARSQDVSDHQR